MRQIIITTVLALMEYVLKDDIVRAKSTDGKALSNMLYAKKRPCKHAWQPLQNG